MGCCPVVEHDPERQRLLKKQEKEKTDLENADKALHLIAAIGNNDKQYLIDHKEEWTPKES